MCFCVNPPCEPYIVHIITFQQTGRTEKAARSSIPKGGLGFGVLLTETLAVVGFKPVNFWDFIVTQRG